MIKFIRYIASINSYFLLIFPFEMKALKLKRHINST